MEKLAIIGTGIAGMGCGHLLHRKYDITLFDKNDYIGGHTNTISVDEGNTHVHMDTGFMVFNYVTYPYLTKMFEEIKAPVKKTSMSFSVQHVPSGLEYSGSGLNGLFAQRRNIFNWRYIRMLKQISRFNEESVKILDQEKYRNYSVREYINEFGYGEDMLWKYLIPMSSAVWSTPMELMLEFPIVTLIRFFQNHGFLGLNTQHQWYTLIDGSESYKKILIAPFKDRFVINNGAKSIRRENGKVIVTTQDGEQHAFDKVVIAAHGDEALAMLEQPTGEEYRLLSCFKYQENIAAVHTDESVMPKTRSIWSSWNYRIEERNGVPVPTTIYWMNSLQGVSDKMNYFVSINPIEGSIDRKKLIRSINYTHPLFDVPAMQAQAELPRLNQSGPVYFCGSYFRYGFHEDAYMSAVELCSKL
jgi:uncharacterized protein